MSTKPPPSIGTSRGKAKGEGKLGRRRGGREGGKGGMEGKEGKKGPKEREMGREGRVEGNGAVSTKPPPSVGTSRGRGKGRVSWAEEEVKGGHGREEWKGKKGRKDGREGRERREGKKKR